MISYEEALAIVLKSIEVQRPISASPEESLGRVLARPVKARLRMPRYDQSAMDGIAVQASL